MFTRAQFHAFGRDFGSAQDRPRSGMPRIITPAQDRYFRVFYAIRQLLPQPLLLGSQIDGEFP